jgi:methylated-DNA-[protein]-cysteine S-methyltransferase
MESVADPADTICYDVLEHSPVGPIAIGATKKGLCALTFGKPARTSYGKIFQQLYPNAQLLLDSSFMKPYRREIERYFDGSIRSFTVPVDLCGVASPFQRRVLTACKKIPFGRTVSYGELAARAGSPRAARAVGNAMAANPIPIVIPCHRVLASQGRLGGYSIGLSFKKRLLSHEGVQLP